MNPLSAMGARVLTWPGAAQAAFWMVILGALVTGVLALVRKVSPGVHVFEIVFFRSLFGLVFMTPWLARRGVAALFFWTVPTWEQLGLMFAIGVLEMLAQRTMSRAYAAADTTVVLAFSFTRLPVAALLGFLLFGEVPELWIWIGGAVITASSVYIAHRESAVRSRAAP
ncbi:MAG: EamA family transporter [Alphaproteobacteria bacterium]|nr:EamA family transporter [Alphaproteobacteria bacterium]